MLLFKGIFVTEKNRSKFFLQNLFYIYLTCLLLGAIFGKSDFNSELYSPTPQNLKNSPHLAKLNYHNAFSLKPSLPFSLCVTLPLLSLSFPACQVQEQLRCHELSEAQKGERRPF